MLLNSIIPSLSFEIWGIEFIRPFPKGEKQTCLKYIIIEVEYVTKWEEEKPVVSRTKEVATKFIY